MVTIIDYKVGNIGSIQNMIKRIGTDAIVSSREVDIKNAEKLILPGVGSFDYGMTQLSNSGLIDVLNQKVLIEKTPILGICLGAQMFTNGSEEGSLKGLSWIDAETKKFKFSDNQKIKVPHMGWNEVVLKKESLLFKDMYLNPRFYFVHSYYLKANTSDDVLTETNYGFDFVSALEKENIVGVQFHPEKSHKFGMKILNNFISYY
jgi:glutamine amidotransferase